MLTGDVPDVIISDVMMPGMDGIELCSRLRADPELGYLPLILLTARAGMDDRIAVLQAGLEDVSRRRQGRVNG